MLILFSNFSFIRATHRIEFMFLDLNAVTVLDDEFNSKIFNNVLVSPGESELNFNMGPLKSLCK
jgi:hypothetical protein